jgi:hypothetical protein
MNPTKSIRRISGCPPVMDNKLSHVCRPDLVPMPPGHPPPIASPSPPPSSLCPGYSVFPCLVSFPPQQCIQPFYLSCWYCFSSIQYIAVAEIHQHSSPRAIASLSTRLISPVFARHCYLILSWLVVPFGVPLATHDGANLE